MNNLRPIPGWEGLYEVTNDGRVWSVRSKKWRATSIHPNGYVIVTFSRGSKQCSMKVHRLVAAAWIPNPERHKFVNHIDGDKKNNNLDNLEWCSKSHDLLHAWKTGLRKVTFRMQLQGSETGLKRRQFNRSQVIQMRRLFAKGWSHSDIGKMFKFSRRSAGDICNRVTYSEIQ